MRELLAAGITFGVLAVSMMIIAGLVAVSYNVVYNIIPIANTGLLNNTSGYAGSSINTFMSLLPVVALALVGGLAIFYVLTYIGGRGAR